MVFVLFTITGGQFAKAYFGVQYEAWGYVLGGLLGIVAAMAMVPGALAAAGVAVYSALVRVAYGLVGFGGAVIRFVRSIPSWIDKAKYVNYQYLEASKNSRIILGRFRDLEGLKRLGQTLGARTLEKSLGASESVLVSNIQSIINSSPQVYVRIAGVLQNPRCFTYLHELTYIYNNPQLWSKVFVIAETPAGQQVVSFAQWTAQTGFVP